MRFFAYILFTSIVITSCKPQEDTLAKEYFHTSLPTYIERVNSLEKIPMSGIRLGEKLFFDPNLSSNGKVSCATCHDQKLSFADGLALSDKGVSGKTLARHTPTLFNLAWHKGYFWDGGAPDLESQALGPLFSEHEMDADLTKIISYLKQNTNYQSEFKEVFDNGEINSKNILKAISWFQLSLISFDSKYDRFKHSNDSNLLSTNEKLGLKIYESQCNSCHTLTLGSNYNYANNGIDKDESFDYPEEDERLGRNRITNDIADLGKYKTPSLRNLSFSPPYMHDGRFQTLDMVLSHYQDLHTQNINTSLSESDKSYLKTFLLTLNDEEFHKK